MLEAYKTMTLAYAKLLMRVNLREDQRLDKATYVKPVVFKEIEGFPYCPLRLFTSDIIWLSVVYTSKPRLK